MSNAKPLLCDLMENPILFQVINNHQSVGDQPQVIAELVKHINTGEQDVVLLDAAGTRKITITAWLIESIQHPALVLKPNKILTAQPIVEFRELLPKNAVEYLASYYNYCQPEAYAPQTNTYIEKDSSINDEVKCL